MNKFIKVILIVVIIGVLLSWLNLNDYYRSDYRELTKEEQSIFEWKGDYDAYLDHRNVYKKYFDVEEFKFPRQEVSKIKILEKDKVFKVFWISRTLKSDHIKDIVSLFNDPENFGWGETTWGDRDVDYILKFYDKNNRLIGKVDMCYHDCGMVRPKPFAPNMKYGQLSPSGKERLFLIIYKLDYWQ